METIVDFLFQPPLVPEGLIRGGAKMIETAFRLVYYRGVMDGFFAGAVFTLIATIRRGRR